MNKTALHIRNATLHYKQQPIFADINLSITEGCWVALLGISGIGKSSLLRLIAGILTADERHQGELNSDLHPQANQQIAYMGQTDLLLPWLSVLDNVLLGYKLRGSKQDQKARATALLANVGLAGKCYHYPHQLSGGMRQRVALVRTLIEDKPIVLMDEPFSALDTITRHQMQALAAEILKDKTVIFVTHDPVEALRLAHDIYLMHGTPAKLKKVLSLPNNSPRELTDPFVTANQHALYEAILAGSGHTI